MRKKPSGQAPSAVKVEVVHGDALKASGDVLALKCAGGRHGLDRKVSEMFEKAGMLLPMPEDGDAGIVDSISGIAASQALVVGVPDLYSFEYSDVRAFARRALAALPLVRQVVMTIHGAGVGLGEIEAFDSEIAGLQDAIWEGRAPQTLKRVSIVDHNMGRAARFHARLGYLLPDGVIRPEKDASEGKIVEGRPAFVAMPFDDPYMDDVYHYGIQGAVSAAGHDCTRVDRQRFQGNIVEKIHALIKKSPFVIADLTGANPNVYNEVGYAQARGIPTVLIAREGEKLEFNLTADNCSFYRNIQHLEEKLTEVLKALGPQPDS